ncbi:MAG: MBL fold metallo-hydrolase [Niastella sp.]|nr:MBL fold metallo-hydrolase [Niastella sp.]
MTIYPLKEGVFSIDTSKKFIPFNLETDHLRDRPGSLLVEIQPFCIVTKKDIILLDTGLGHCLEDGTLQLHQQLLMHGISPMDITKVLLSHLHKDHAGGIAIDNFSLPAFPNAVYYVNNAELTYGLQKNNASYIAGEFLLLKDANFSELLPEQSGSIDGYIHYQHSGAHCPHHIVYRIEEDRQIIFFGGDEAPQLQQMKNKFIAKYDFDGRKAMELRQKWWQEGLEKKWTFLFYHDLKSPIYKG